MKKSGLKMLRWFNGMSVHFKIDTSSDISIITKNI